MTSVSVGFKTAVLPDEVRTFLFQVMLSQLLMEWLEGRCYFNAPLTKTGLSNLFPFKEALDLKIF